MMESPPEDHELLSPDSVDGPSRSDSNLGLPAADMQRGEPAGERGMVTLAVLFEGGLAVLALGIGWLVGFWPLQDFSWSISGLLWGVAGTVPPVIGLLLIDRFPIGPMAGLKKVVEELIVPLFRKLSIAHLAVIALLAGIGEELLFRGLLQGGLDSYLQQYLSPAAATGTALAVSSIVFGLMHPITRTYVVLCVMVGIYLGAIWLLTGNLLVPIIVHGLYDFVALVYLVRRPAAG